MPDITREQVIEAMRKAIGIEHCALCSDLGTCLREINPCVCAQEAEAALTAIEALGFKIVPYEPTEEMEEAINPGVKDIEYTRKRWRAMLSASPLYKEPSNG